MRSEVSIQIHTRIWKLDMEDFLIFKMRRVGRGVGRCWFFGEKIDLEMHNQ